MKAVKKTHVEKLENSAVKLTITVDGAKTRESYNDTLAKYSKQVQMKGFRKGHVPTSVLENKFGDSIKAEAFYNTLEGAVQEALESVKEKPYHASTPTLLNEEDLKPELDKDFTFTVQYDVFPEFELAQWEGIEVEVPTVSITKKDIDAELKKIQDQNAMMIDKTDGVVEKDNSVTVDYAELDADKKEVAGKKGQDFTFTVGSGYSPYKMDDDVIGMKKGESKEITKTFAADDTDKELAGKTITFNVTIKGVKVKDIPALDDDLAQDVNEKFKTLDDLKADTEKKLNEQLENRIKSKKAEQVFEKIIADCKIELPESMIQAELHQNLHNFAAQMGMQPEQLVQMLGKGNGEEDPLKGLMDEWRPNTEKNLKQSLILNKIVEEQKIEVSDKDLEAEYKQIAEENNRPVNEIKDYYVANHAEQYLKAEMQSKKALDLILEKAVTKAGKKVSFLELMEN